MRRTIGPSPYRAHSHAHAHTLLWQWRGSASTYGCAVCPARAQHWAYDHADECELVAGGVMGGARYSVDMSHYQPMCMACHRRFDVARARMGRKDE